MKDFRFAKIAVSVFFFFSFFFLEFLSLRYHGNVSAKYPMESLPIDENGELLVITLEN